MSYENFAIKASEGMFYTTSKTPAEGYVENKYTDRDTKEDRVNYHKSVPTLSGRLKSVSTKDTPTIGERFQIVLEEGGVYTTLEIPVFNSNGSVNDYVKAFCQIIENLKIGAETKIELNKTAKDKQGYLYKNVYVSQNGEKVNWAFKTFGVDSIVPKATKTKHKVTKKEVWDFSDIDAFYYELLEKHAPKRVQQSSTSTAAPSAETIAEAPALDNTASDVVDDLPF